MTKANLTFAVDGEEERINSFHGKCDVMAPSFILHHLNHMLTASST